MSKAKIASKNNPDGRGKAKQYKIQDMVIKPVKLISSNGTILAAEYEETGDLVLDQNGNPLPWNNAKIAG